jgi:hypothetical protein
MNVYLNDWICSTGKGLGMSIQKYLVGIAAMAFLKGTATVSFAYFRTITPTSLPA